ncbi:MAG: hypothetical protein WKF84_28770 [Pyrinomonadaceae bacterium]
MKETPRHMKTADKAAQELGVSRPTLCRLMQSELIGFYRVGKKKVFFSDKHIADFLADCERKPQKIAA